MKAHDDLTFKVIGATIESPTQNPLLASINQECVAIKRNCLDGTPVAFALLAEGLGCGQQAHFSSGSLGFAEGSSTASFCGAPPILNDIDLEFKNDLLDMTPKAHAIKEKIN